MLDKLIEEGKTFNNDFTENYNLGVERGIKNEVKSNYFQWLAKLGTYAEGNLKNKYPKMTEIVLDTVNKKSVMRYDFDIILGYLDSIKEQEDIKGEKRIF